MKKAVALLLVAVFACAMLAGCSNNTEVDPILEESASPSPSATASGSPSPTPTVDPNAAGEGVPTPRVDEAVTVGVIDAGFDELYKASPYVVIGHLTKSLGRAEQRPRDGRLRQPGHLQHGEAVHPRRDRGPQGRGHQGERLHHLLAALPQQVRRRERVHHARLPGAAAEPGDALLPGQGRRDQPQDQGSHRHGLLPRQ